MPLCWQHASSQHRPSAKTATVSHLLRNFSHRTFSSSSHKMRDRMCMDFWAIPPRGPHFARRQRREAGRERLASTDNQLSFPSTAPAGGREEAAAEAASAPAPPAPSPPSSKPRTASPASFITWEKGLARLNSMELKVADVDVVDQGRWVAWCPWFQSTVAP